MRSSTARWSPRYLPQSGNRAKAASATPQRDRQCLGEAHQEVPWLARVVKTCRITTGGTDGPKRPCLSGPSRRPAVHHDVEAVEKRRIGFAANTCSGSQALIRLRHQGRLTRVPECISWRVSLSVSTPPPTSRAAGLRSSPRRARCRRARRAASGIRTLDASRWRSHKTTGSCHPRR